MFIFLLILHFVTAALLFCFRDEFTVDFLDYEVSKPSLNDLKQKDNILIHQQYNDEILTKATEYFTIKEKLSNISFSTSTIAIVFLQAISFVLLNVYLPKSVLLPNNYIKAIAILLVCLLGSFIIYLIHKRNTKIKPFDFETFKKEYSKGCYTSSFEFEKRENPIDFNFNNHLMLNHLKYLKEIEETIVVRNYLNKYFLFFVFLLYVVLGAIYIK